MKSMRAITHLSHSKPTNSFGWSAMPTATASLT